ncbi:MAG: SH3 domain-containing protein [Treponema sp.]|nr:SH3 domain-containing protein [Treponema sp.]
MRKIVLAVLVFNAALSFSQDFDRSQYLFMTYHEAIRQYFDTGERDRHYVMEAHFIEKNYQLRKPQVFIFTNDPAQYWILNMECNPDIPDLPRGTVIRVYYRRWPAPGGNNPTFIDFIEPVPKRFIAGHAYGAFENLNIRTGPGTSSAKITTIGKSDMVQIIEEGPEETIDGINSSWVRVRLKSGQTGWAFGGYLEYWEYWLRRRNDDESDYE